jgi:HSP20 family molecular chaperone IbpA
MVGDMEDMREGPVGSPPARELAERRWTRAEPMMATSLRRMFDQLWSPGLRFQNVGAIGEFEVRAEIPGVDPARDIQIWLSGGILRVEVTREPTRADQVRSEFHYGRSMGFVDLPGHVDVYELSATYHRGVLTIANAAGRSPGIEVAIGSGDSGPSYLDAATSAD